jgi:hypothetical protein
MNKMMISAVMVMAAWIALGGELRFKDAEIVLPEKPFATAKIAAEELQYHLRKMTGGSFPIVTARTSRYATAIYVGDQPAAAKVSLSLKQVRPDGFLRSVKGKDIYILGDDDQKKPKGPVTVFYFETRRRGTLHGVYDFLEELGVRWPAPGKRYEYIPAREEIVISDAEKNEAPVFSQRNMTRIHNFMKYNDAKVYADEAADATWWALRMRASWIRGIGDGSHTEQLLKLPEIWFKDHPERFQLMKNGKRNPRYICWSDPAVKEIWLKAADAYFSGKMPADAGLPHVKSWRGWNVKEEFLINAMDHGPQNDGRCRCERCNAFRKKHPCLDDTELYWQVIAYVAKEIEKKHPGKFIGALVYPPMTRFPKTVELPKNLRIRICQSGIKTVLLPAVLKENLEQIRLWTDHLGVDKVCLGIYVMETFGGRLPAFPENYPHLAAEYFRTIEGKCTGTRIAYTAPTHTERVLDMYVQSKLLWNPRQDVDAIINDHCRVMYGPAAEVMKQIYERFEKNFSTYYKTVTPDIPNPREIGIGRDDKANRIFAWSKVYTEQEMKTVGDLLDKAEKLAGGKQPYAQRLQVFRTWIYGMMTAERKQVLDIQANSLQIQLKRNRWCPWQNFHSMDIYNKNMAPTRFRMKHDGKQLILQVIAEEPEMKKVLFDPAAAPENVWKDDTIELFIENQGRVRQIIFSASGKCTSRLVPEEQWGPVPGLVHSVHNHTRARRLEIALPLPQGKGGSFRMNLTRSRKLTTRYRESSTWSESAKRGWTDPSGYAAVMIR